MIGEYGWLRILERENKEKERGCIHIQCAYQKDLRAYATFLFTGCVFSALAGDAVEADSRHHKMNGKHTDVGTSDHVTNKDTN